MKLTGGPFTLPRSVPTYENAVSLPVWAARQSFRFARAAWGGDRVPLMNEARLNVSSARGCLFAAPTGGNVSGTSEFGLDIFAASD
jgi:hypothetical protein